MLHAFPPVCPQGQGQRPLRPALRRVRPGPGPHRGGVGQGRPGEDGRQRRPPLPGACHRHQGAARGAREAPRLRPLERLLQGPALREVPRAAPAGQRHPEGPLGRQGVHRPGDGPEGARLHRPDRQDLLGDEEGLTLSHAA
ncbi:Nickel-dependent superoxide dismutase [Streptomyces misionensis JCM 4497]